MELNNTDSVIELLNNTSLDRIFLTSDWHIFKNRYKKEANLVNTQNIIKWCKDNIKEDDIFMYLGDISYRWTKGKDKTEVESIMSSLPGKKILIIGNHDKFTGKEDYYTGCGFDYAFDELRWKDLIFTHKPIDMHTVPDIFTLNIHGHMHNERKYNTTDGSQNINVYPLFFDNKPVTLKYVLSHKEELMKDNERSNWVNMDEFVLPSRHCGISYYLETKRSNLKNSQFGIPEDRKFPLDTREHVNSAIKLFGHAEESKKYSLAKRIKVAADKYGITISKKSQVYKYLGEIKPVNESVKTIIPSEIDTIIFDMGSVLVDDIGFELYKDTTIPEEYHEEVYKLIGDYLFFKTKGSKNKSELMRCSFDDVVEYMINEAPEHLKQYMLEALQKMCDSLFVFSYTYDLLHLLRSKGYKLYYLSNWDKWSFEKEGYVFDRLLKEFDGGLFSYEYGIEKPDTEIYYKLVNKYGINTSSSLFIDDKYENVETAVKYIGMHGIVFNQDIPKMILNNETILSSGDSLKKINLNDIKWWYLSKDKKPFTIDKEMYYNTLEDAIKFYTQDIDGKCNMYVFTCNGGLDYEDALKMIPLGQITIDENKYYKWNIQYPVVKNGDRIDSLLEWSMAACNPVVGILKPYVLKVQNDCGSLINAKKYALAPDLISDKYLIVDEDCKLSVVDSNYFDNCIVEQYEFIGNKKYLERINKAYKEERIVDESFIYTALSDRLLLSEDQIDFDENFIKVDLNLEYEKQQSSLSTFINEFYEYTNNPIGTIFNIAESMFIDNPLKGELYRYDDKISLMEDVNGYFYYDHLSKKRTRSVASMDLLTETMIKSIL